MRETTALDRLYLNHKEEHPADTFSRVYAQHEITKKVKFLMNPRTKEAFQSLGKYIVKGELPVKPNRELCVVKGETETLYGYERIRNEFCSYPPKCSDEARVTKYTKASQYLYEAVRAAQGAVHSCTILERYHNPSRSYFQQEFHAHKKVLHAFEMFFSAKYYESGLKSGGDMYALKTDLLLEVELAKQMPPILEEVAETYKKILS